MSVTDTIGNVVLEAANAVPTVAANLTSAGGAFSFNDGATALAFGTVAAAPALTDPSLLFQAVVSEQRTTGNGDVNLRSGGLAINQPLNVGQRDAASAWWRKAGPSFAKNALTGAITAGALSVTDSGGQAVLEAPNAVGTVAASLTTSGSAFSFADGTTALTVGSVGAAATGADPTPLFGATVTGIATNSGDVNLKSAGLTLTNAVGAGSGIVRLVGGGAVSEAATGAITASSLVGHRHTRQRGAGGDKRGSDGRGQFDRVGRSLQLQRPGEFADGRHRRRGRRRGGPVGIVPRGDRRDDEQWRR